MEIKTKCDSPLSFPDALFLCFMMLKMMGHVEWSWWWVFAPLWVPAALVLLRVAFGRR